MKYLISFLLLVLSSTVLLSQNFVAYQPYPPVFVVHQHQDVPAQNAEKCDLGDVGWLGSSDFSVYDNGQLLLSVIKGKSKGTHSLVEKCNDWLPEDKQVCLHEWIYTTSNTEYEMDSLRVCRDCLSAQKKTIVWGFKKE